MEMLARPIALAATLLVAVTAFATGVAWADNKWLAKPLKSVVSVLPERAPGTGRAEEPEGTGVVILDGKTVITAFHVVEHSRSIRVRTASGEILAAELQGVDKATDLALLKIGTALPALEFGADVELGERVCTIGNAFGLGLSVTCGTVSAVNRAGVGFNPIEDFVQTDAAVNPGASGGALIDGEGALIGILSAIFTKQSDANIGVNFAVSAPLSKRVAEELSAKGAIDWNLGGVGLKPYPARGETGRMAAEAVRVRKGGAAERAGMQPGDHIVQANGRRIRKPADFRSTIARLHPGTEMVLMVFRNGTSHELTLRLGAE